MPEPGGKRRLIALVLALVCFAPPVLSIVVRFLASTGVNRQGMVVLAACGVAGTLLACWGLGLFRRTARDV